MLAAAGGSGCGPGPGPGLGGDGDFLSRYRLVSAKLRRRFLRKPNVAEAAEQFAALARELRAQESLPYAAWCQLAVARCAQSLFHGPAEAAALAEAARLFLRQERDLRQRLGLRGGFGEHVAAAQSCGAFAARLHLERGQPALAAGPCLELAAALRDTGRPARAAAPLQRAAELLAAARLPLEALRCLAERASCLLLGRDYAGALAALTRAQALAGAGAGAGPGGGAAPGGAFLDVLARCEVSRVLLLLLLQPPPAKLLPEHARTLEQYCWEAAEGGAGPGPGCACGAGGGPPAAASYLPAELFLLLQSAVLACQEKDAEALKALQAELWPLLSAEQNHLLHLVLQEMLSPAGQGL
ncbi:40-kDa huntingtin-associated protein-like [Colius striatus]|uniref:40-kDa huntingtin-associated protein-like n=1 Tax=Colius striatus TaxID=57412 RepID=UPI002B1D2FA8|nr:40-kDa huntingtin-associated protein-like [Colius striatus]XP_061862624.1 40-kDa huntingtin-associated protein-like [Colius striatus]